MSEYQRVHFVACDRLLNDEQLAFMSEQSSRAEVTQRSFDNEYHFGSFRGDALEMLRRGYDAHLHFADFGIRRVRFRLPGPPVPMSVLLAFGGVGSVVWEPDNHRRSAGPGILTLEPADSDGETFAEDWGHDPTEAIAALPAVREALLRGDARPLSLGWLAGFQGWWGADDLDEDDEAFQLPPVPAGLADLPPAMDALADFFVLSSDHLAAIAAPASDAAVPTEADAQRAAEAFVAGLPEADLRHLATDLLAGDPAAVAASLRMRQRGAAPTAAWPLLDDSRSLAELFACADELAANAARARAVAEAQRERASALWEAEQRERAIAQARSNPDAELDHIEASIGTRTAEAYRSNFKALSILHEALGPIAARATFSKLAVRLNARDRRPVGLVRMMEEAGWID